MSKLEELSRAIAAEVRDRQAHLTATETQLKALQQTHADLHQKVSDKQKELADVTKDIDGARAVAERIEADARRHAGEILNEADKMNREAHATIAAAQEEARQIVKAAQDEAAKYQPKIAQATQQLNDAMALANSIHLEIAAIKKRARDFADS